MAYAIRLADGNPCRGSWISRAETPESTGSRARSVERADAVADREFDQGRKIADIQLAHHAAAIGLDRFDGQGQGGRDLGAGLAFDDELSKYIRSGITLNSMTVSGG